MRHDKHWSQYHQIALQVGIIVLDASRALHLVLIIFIWHHLHSESRRSMFNIVLFTPEIPPNTGNIMRLCANSGCKLHLIEPLGFSLDDKQVKRAGLDYIPKTTINIYKSLEQYMDTVKDKTRIFCCTTKAETFYSDIQYKDNDIFLFGPETMGQSDRDAGGRGQSSP